MSVAPHASQTQTTVLQLPALEISLKKPSAIYIYSQLQMTAFINYNIIYEREVEYNKVQTCVIRIRVTLAQPTEVEFESYHLLMPSEDDIYKSRLPIKHLQKSGLPLFHLVVGVQQLDALILLPQRFNSFQILSLRPAFFSPNDLALVPVNTLIANS